MPAVSLGSHGFLRAGEGPIPQSLQSVRFPKSALPACLHAPLLSSPSALRSFRSRYRSVRKRLLTRVDFPRPDSPDRGERTEAPNQICNQEATPPDQGGGVAGAAALSSNWEETKLQQSWKSSSSLLIWMRPREDKRLPKVTQRKATTRKLRVKYYLYLVTTPSPATYTYFWPPASPSCFAKRHSPWLSPALPMPTPHI